MIAAEAGFTAQANSNWVLSARRVTVAPGETYTLARKLVAASNGFGDPWKVLEGR